MERVLFLSIQKLVDEHYLRSLEQRLTEIVPIFIESVGASNRVYEDLLNENILNISTNLFFVSEHLGVVKSNCSACFRFCDEFHRMLKNLEFDDFQHMLYVWGWVVYQPSHKRVRTRGKGTAFPFTLQAEHSKSSYQWSVFTRSRTGSYCVEELS